tara:strand:+ start:188 stop:346 length:159 start_codon:yes stop_codon:yes gene_type:complete
MSQEQLNELTKTFLVFEKACAEMYKLVMENNKRLNHIEKEFVKLERSLKKGG